MKNDTDTISPITFRLSYRLVWRSVVVPPRRYHIFFLTKIHINTLCYHNNAANYVFGIWLFFFSLVYTSNLKHSSVFFFSSKSIHTFLDIHFLPLVPLPLVWMFERTKPCCKFFLVINLIAWLFVLEILL